MHAEVTNTMNHTSSLSPCRVCHLSVELVVKKRSKGFVCDFVGIGETGERVGQNLACK